MKLWKYNCILLLISISLSYCSVSDSLISNLENYERKNIDKNNISVENFVNNNAKISNENNEDNYKGHTTNAGKFNIPKNKKNTVNYKIIYLKNKVFKHTDKNVLAKINNYEKCKIKQGVLNFLKVKDKKNHILKIIPINVIINQYSITFYENETFKSMFNSLKLDDVTYITKTYKNTNCFDIISSKFNSKKTKIKRIKTTLCANTKDLKKEWMKAIQEFKECKAISQHLVSSKDGNNKVVMDFNKVNILMKQKNRKVAISQQNKAVGNNSIKSSDRLNQLYYDNSNSDSINTNAIKDAEELQMKKEVSNIFKTLTYNAKLEQQANRKLKNELREARKVARKVEKKRLRMEREIKKKEVMAQKKIEEITDPKKTVKKHKELELLHAVSQKLAIFAKDKIKKVRKNISKEILKEKAKANENANEMMNIIHEQDRQRDYSKCTNPKLLCKILNK